MNKITTIHLNGKAFQLEEAAYKKLQTYLEEAELELAKNPDKTEIMTDLEQAIADKAAVRLHAGKDVVTEVELDSILQEMGRVEADAQSDKSKADDKTGSASDFEGSQSNAAQAKKLYNIQDGALIAGVCNGLATYFNLDVTLVRLAFVALAVFTGGGVILAYLILALVLPEAKTSEQVAQAKGQPLTAQDIVANSKQRLQQISVTVQKNQTAKNVLWLVLLIGVVVFILAFGAAIVNFFNIVLQK